MVRDITFTVPGNPIALKRHRSTKTGIQYDPSKGDKQDFLAKAMQHRPDTPWTGPVEVYMTFVFPRPKSFFDLLGEAFGGEKEDDEFTFVKLARPGVGSKYAALPSVAAGLDALQSIDPGKAKALQNFLIQMELFSDERVLMVDTSLSTLCP